MFYNEDCISGAKQHLESESVDLIITDPPYGIGGDQLHKHYNRNEANVIEGYIEVADRDYTEFSKLWIKEAERVLKPGGSIYIVSGYTKLRDILNALAETQLQERNHIIWKYNFGVFTSKKYISSHFHILYYVKRGGSITFNTNSFYSDSEKNDKGGSLNYLHREDVWNINKEYKRDKIKNKNELPFELLSKMILYSSNPDDMVCDFFLGSFSTAKAAIGLGRNACGFELNKNAFDYQMQTIQSIEKGSMLHHKRQIPANLYFNQGKKISENEIKDIVHDFDIHKSNGLSKKAAIDILSIKYGRGFWSINNIIKSAVG